MSLNTPRSNRLHIAIYGKRNSGKSSLINSITRQEASLVSDIAGTTTDPIYKAMEVPNVGPCIFIDTAGLDDEGQLGNLRVQQTLRTMDQADIAIIVCNDAEIKQELSWTQILKKKNIPLIWILNKADLLSNPEEIAREIKAQCGQMPLITEAITAHGIEYLWHKLSTTLPDRATEKSIAKHLVNEGDTVLLIMPQDTQAPKGRLILPQVQTIRELLDHRCLVLSCTPDKIENMLKALVNPPHLIITDSQVFHSVYEKKPESSRLTSFSVLFAQYKGDIDYFIQSANTLRHLTSKSRVLIAEACTHTPQNEDIGTVKIPNLLRKKFGSTLQIDHVTGNDFPEDLTSYQLIIHCGGCIFNRKYVLNRIERARNQNVPMTNYGICIAWLNNILDKIDY